MTSEQRKAAENGIWLCSDCATEIDKDPTRFPVVLLHDWKAVAEREALALLASPTFKYLGISKAPFAPPLQYQLAAVRQVINHLRRSGVSEASVAQLTQVMPDLSLRDGINPIFEPLRIEAVVDALDYLIRAGEINVTRSGGISLDRQAG